MNISYLTIAMYIILTYEGPDMELPSKEILHFRSHTDMQETRPWYIKPVHKLN